MHRATLYQKLASDLVKCTACAHYCHIQPDNTGVCGIRKNIKGELFLLPYARPAAVNIDPIEKKPLFHFLPGTQIFSLGTVGCNFACAFCQNWDISQLSKGKAKFDLEKLGEDWPPQKIVDYCLEHNIPSIAYTYNEPTIFIEYAYDTAKLANQAGLKNVFVSNGYGSAEAYDFIDGYLDAINIDLKSFQPEFYQKICHANIKPVLANIKRLHDAGVWVEVTTLVVPGQNDSVGELKAIAQFLAKIDPDIPWHISRFFPQYKMEDSLPTPLETLELAYKIGKTAGLNYVYVGNCPDSKWESTDCPKCKKRLIERTGYEIGTINLKNGQCQFCKTKIAGKWE